MADREQKMIQYWKVTWQWL